MYVIICENKSRVTNSIILFWLKFLCCKLKKWRNHGLFTGFSYLKIPNPEQSLICKSKIYWLDSRGVLYSEVISILWSLFLLCLLVSLRRRQVLAIKFVSRKYIIYGYGVAWISGRPDWRENTKFQEKPFFF